MKWDSSVKQPDGTRVRTAQFQDHREAHIVTDYDGKRVTVHRLGDDFDLAEATPCHRMETSIDGRRRYRPGWLGSPHPVTNTASSRCRTKDKAIEFMLTRREQYQGRSMG